MCESNGEFIHVLSFVCLFTVSGLIFLVFLRLVVRVDTYILRPFSGGSFPFAIDEEHLAQFVRTSSV